MTGDPLPTPVVADDYFGDMHPILADDLTAFVRKEDRHRSLAVVREEGDRDLIAEGRQWLDKVRADAATVDACTAVRRAVERWADGSREGQMRGVLAVVRLDERGHRGLAAALDELWSVRAKDGRDFWRLVEFARGRVIARPSPPVDIGCRCDAKTRTIGAPRMTPPGDDEPKKSITTQLVELAEEYYRVLLAEDGAPYAVELQGPNLAVPLRGRDSLRQRLARLFFDNTGRAPAGAALADALAVLEGAAIRKPREPVALRLARDFTGAIVLDLGRADGRCVIVEPGGWDIAGRSPILFRRTALTGEMALPVGGGAVEELLVALVNADQKMVRLIVAWLVAALIPDLPHPILGVFGEQGTAKTTLMRLLSLLVDPSPAPTRTAPRDLGQWAVTASASWVVCLDNVSTIPEWLSDALCRAVTGDGLTTRALYSDSDVSVLTFRRVLAMTSIDAGALRGDLGERLLPIELDVIAAAKRKPDADIAGDFAAAAPKLLGALLDLLASVLAAFPKVHTTTLPRMADFARVLHAVDAVTEWSTVGDYAGTAADVAETVIDSDPVAVAIRGLAPPGGEWTGTATELLEKITPERPPKGWPRSPRAVGGVVKRITPALRAVGVTVDHGRTPDHARTRTLTFTSPTYASCDPPSEPSEPSDQGGDQRKRSDGSSDATVRGSDGRRTVRTVAAASTDQPSDASTALDLRERQTSDGSDGSDGRGQQLKRPPEPRCERCGERLLLPDGRALCNRCKPNYRSVE